MAFSARSLYGPRHHSMPPPRNMVPGKYVLAAALGLSIFITVSVMVVALATRRPPAPPPMPRSDQPAPVHRVNTPVTSGNGPFERLTPASLRREHRRP